MPSSSARNHPRAKGNPAIASAGSVLRRLLAALALIVATAGASCGKPPVGPGPAPTPSPTPRPSPRATPKPVAPGVVDLRWIAYRQEDVARYEVYRSENEDGPWVRATTDDDYIQGEGYATERREYSFLDKGLVPGKAYYYKINEVGLSERVRPFNRRPLRKVAVDPALVMDDGAGDSDDGSGHGG